MKGSGGEEGAGIGGDGVRRVIYGLKKVGESAVELENGVLIRMPSPLFPSDCRGCSLVDFICVELDYPCPGIYLECRKSGGGIKCEKCNKMTDCLDSRPCCWHCRHLLECADMARDGGGEDFVEHRFNCSWEEFIEAVKMLTEK